MAAKTIMIQGTMSNVGKSLIAAGLCRIFKQDGYRTAPFKSQNMALNSYITRENLEMGRAQAVQAEACGIEPSAQMNPILLKPTSDMGSQVILNGETAGNMKAMEYFRRKKEYVPLIRKAYEGLAKEYDIIVIEGAGSPAEINLKQNDIVNMGMAQMADAPVLLAGDIDRGGVFAQLLGTLELLEPEERERIKGLIINKFRGDAAILEPGLAMLEERTKKKIFGVVPYMQVDLEEEDSLAESLGQKNSQKTIDIAVIRFPRISNFTDMQALSMEPDVSVRYVEKVSEIKRPDLLVLPGTKNTIEDMRWLRSSGLEGAILQWTNQGGLVFGICGGYQMLGYEILDASGVEGGGSIRGLGLLPVKTEFHREKIRSRSQGKIAETAGIWKSLSGKTARGYQMHMGVSTEAVLERGGADGHFCKGPGSPLVWLEDSNGAFTKPDGCFFENAAGTYLHGIFDEEDFRKALIGLLYQRKGLVRNTCQNATLYEYKEQQYNKLASVLREHLQMEEIYRIMGV